MKQFSELGITTSVQSFTGDKIKIERILNRQIIVHSYKIEESKFKEKGNGKCLYLQIGINDIKYVVFTGSTVLMDLIKKVPADALPFQTTVIKQGEHFEFS